MSQEINPGRDMWAVGPGSIEQYGPEVADPEKISTWCQAYFYGGNTLRLWNEAVELKMALLTAGSLEKGQKVLIVGKYVAESGLERAVSSLVGQEGRLSVEEIGARAITAFKDALSAPAPRIQWDFDYFDNLPDNSLDRVILFGSASHINNMGHCAQQIHRVLQNGGRVVIADAPWGGKELITAAHLDTHLEGMYDKLLAGMKLGEEDLSRIDTEELNDIFQSYLTWSRGCSWQGLYLFYGQKEGGEEARNFEFPLSTEAVQAFLTEKPSAGPWDFLSQDEVDLLGSEVTDTAKQKNWGHIINMGGGFTRTEEYSSVSKPMWENLRVKPGDKALVVGEFLDGLWLRELKKHKGDIGDIAAFDLSIIHKDELEDMRDAGVPTRLQWDYPFADDYPDEYFDLIWFPQGVHHALSWKGVAPRLLRALKPDGQIMMFENRVGCPEFFNGVQMSGLMKCIVEKIILKAFHTTWEEVAYLDYSTAVLEEAFNASLRDTYSLEWKGWLLYWGYKK